MNMDTIDIKQLEEAVIVFYRSTSQEQAITHEWLTKAQASPQAWSFSWQLMQPGKTQEVQFFGAITLHSKLMKFWTEVPPENREELKQKLLETIIQFANGPKIVLNRLCISLSAFIVHMLGEWNTAIEDIINTFKNLQIPNVTADMQLWIMLEVLQGIPEEANAIYTSVKRATLRVEIAKKSPVVIQTIESYLEAQLERKWTDEMFSNMSRAVKCAGTWIKNLGYCIENCVKLSDILLKITNKCYWNCMQDEEADECMTAEENDLAETCLKTLVSIIIQPDCHNYPKTAFLLIKMFLDSLCGITKSECKENNNNEDIVVNIYTLFISAIERHSQILLTGITTSDPEHSQLYQKLVHEILACTDKPGIFPVEESCSTLAMGFWFMMQDEVLSIQNTQDKFEHWAKIKPLYAHLTTILIRKARQPDETSIDRWCPDDLESFRCYRQDISDTLLYCYDVLNYSILEILSETLEAAKSEMEVNPNSWTNLEACIYAFHSISEHIDGSEKIFIPKLINTLSEIRYNAVNDKLLGTALECIGSYCLWFLDNPMYIGNAIRLLVDGLNSAQSSQATLGLKDICRDCQLQMKPFAEPVLVACQSALASGRLKNTDSVRLMYSIGKLMSMLNVEQIPTYLDIIVSPCFEELQLVCQSGAKTPSNKIRTLYRLNMISTLFSSLNTDFDDEQIDDLHNTQPVLLVMQKTMPLFRQIAEVWIEETEVVEMACNALIQALKNLQNDFKPMLQDMCCFIISIFQNKCCAPALEISKTAIVLFYKDESCKPMMQELFIQSVLYTVRVFEQTQENQFSNIADLIESFFSTNTQMIKKSPSIFENENVDLKKLIMYALKAVTLPETGPVKNGIQFISHFIMQSRNFTNMTKTVLESGEEIVRCTILCIGCYTPRALVESFADIFLSINKKYPAELVAWMKLLATPNFPTPNVDDAEKFKFMSQIIREKVNKRLLQNYIADFAARSRGFVEKI
ncbi:importin-13 [Condylostylus longicornis]|uniref:importin-13 n=1 Tax=Condylostylus longicornis TaxID=2530218 RepID=UPI00244DAAE3|nr:importin-13 [Condylostylus longicornis]